MVTSLVPELLGKDALLNEIAEIERRALEEERRTYPRYVRYRFLRGFRVSLRGVVYGLEWVTVRLPVLYRGEDWSGGGVAQGGGAGAQGPPPARVGREVERQALDPGAKVGDFKYVVVDGKYVKLRGGRRGCHWSRWDSLTTV